MEGRDEAVLQGQAKVWDCRLAFVGSMALKCAMELRIADMINSHGCPISFNQIIQGMKAPSPDISCLFRIMRVLVRKGIFTVNSSGDDILYDLTESSKWLLHDTSLTVAPMVLLDNHPMLLVPWHYLSNCVEEGGITFKKCREAIPKKTIKVIIVDVMLQPDGEGVFDNTRLEMNLLMIAHTSGGKERSDVEWKKLLKDGGFPNYNIILLPALQLIIEAYPE